jgi:hypothetical protein
MIIQTPTPNSKKSIDFYKQLNFEIIQQDDVNFVTDGTVIIEINDNRTARLGIKLYQNSWKSVVNELSKITSVLKQDNGYLLSDSSGSWIYLMEMENPVQLDISTISKSIIGSYAGVSLEVLDIEKTAEIWTLLGFSKTMGSIEQGWVVYGNSEQASVSFMKPNSCPHLFFNPSLTYFNGKDNLTIIENVRKTNLEITEEITVFNDNNIVDNIIIRDPGGLGFFLFSD